jgi:hypothetical protein
MRACKDLVPGLGDSTISADTNILERRLQDGLLELGRVASVEGYCCPVVSPVVEIGGTEIDHGFLASASPIQRSVKLTIVNTCPASIRPGVFDPP